MIEGEKSMKKKKTRLVVVLAIVSILVILGGREIYKYNTLAYRLGIAKSTSGKTEHPGLTFGANSNFGVSEKAVQRSEAVLKDWHEKVGNMVLKIEETYSSERMIKVEYNVVDGKTEVRMYGEGIPKGETEKQTIDERILLNYLFELDKDVFY